MSQALTVFLNLFAYSDGAKTNNPQLRDFDYSRRLSDVPTSKTRSQQYIIPISSSQTVLSTARSLTTGASWTISNPQGVTSRFTWSGTNPVIRTERTGGSLAIGDSIIVARQAASKAVLLTFAHSIGSGIVPGDELFIGAGSGLSPINQGYFVVAAASGNTVTVLSPDMVNETQTVTDPIDVYAYSTGPVKVGDFLRVSNSAFNPENRGEFQITAVTSRFIEVQNTNLVPEGPITADVVVYDQLYKLTYVEADQPVNIYINGNPNPTSIEPVQNAEAGLIGLYLVRGPVWSVTVENVDGLNAANVTTFFAT